jgi:uncharacterized membrane protein (GlpM family)
MSDERAEQALTWFDAPSERPRLELSRARNVSRGSLLVRFAFGAATSAIAGIISMIWNSSVAGIMLAFPAILAASLTLIADDETRRAAREDARGAVVGAVALGAFALVCYFGFRRLNPVLVLALAMLAWVSAACGLYVLLWAPSRGLFSPRAIQSPRRR